MAESRRRVGHRLTAPSVRSIPTQPRGHLPSSRRARAAASVTATLHLQDGPNDLGNVTFTFRLGTTVTRRTLLEYGADHYSRHAAHWWHRPRRRIRRRINVSGVTGTVSRVAVRLKGFNHTWPDDVDMLLVGPGGQKMIILSDAIGMSAWRTNRTYLLDDTAAAIMPASGNPASGTFRPANYGAGRHVPGSSSRGTVSVARNRRHGHVRLGVWWPEPEWQLVALRRRRRRRRCRQLLRAAGI